MPASVMEEIADYGLDLTLVGSPEDTIDAAHVFVTDSDSLMGLMTQLRKLIAKDGQVWVSWPKKGSGKETLLNQASVQQIGISAGFVDTKKCAVDAIWSGLKFVIPQADR